jgi:hypothetical protein
MLFAEFAYDSPSGGGNYFFTPNELGLGGGGSGMESGGVMNCFQMSTRQKRKTLFWCD